MILEEALAAMRNGKRARRSAWSNKDFCVRIDGKFFVDANGLPVSAINQGDILADDWEIVADPLSDEQLIAEWERKAANIRAHMHLGHFGMSDCETWAGAYEVCARQLRERKL